MGRARSGRDRRPGRARARGAGGRVLAVGRRGGGRRGGGGGQRAAARRGRGGAPGLLVARLRAGHAGAPAGHRRGEGAAGGPPRHGRLARRAPADGARRGPPDRVGNGGHEGRCGALAGRAARPGPHARALRGDRAAAGGRRGVAHRALRPRRALRGLRRLAVLRGRRARPRWRGGGDRQAQGGGHAARDARTGLPPTRARRPTRAATPCWPWPRWPGGWRRPTTPTAPTG